MKEKKRDRVYWLTFERIWEHVYIHLLSARHMHEDDEIRFILSGSGFFDVRGA